MERIIMAMLAGGVISAVIVATATLYALLSEDNLAFRRDAHAIVQHFISGVLYAHVVILLGYIMTTMLGFQF